MGELKNYSAAGLPVRIRFGGLDYGGRIRRIAAAFDNPSYLVDLDEPIPFEDHATALGLKGAEQEALYRQIVSDGCLLRDDFIGCLWMPWEGLELTAREGLFTEYMEPSCETEETCKGQIRRMKTWPGKIMEISPDITVLQLLDPVPVEAAPTQGLKDSELIGDYVDPDSNLLVMLPVDLAKSAADHGLRVLRPATADYYSQFDL